MLMALRKVPHPERDPEPRRRGAVEGRTDSIQAQFALASQCRGGERGDALPRLRIGLAVAARWAEMALEGGDHLRGRRVLRAGPRRLVADRSELFLKLGDASGRRRQGSEIRPQPDARARQPRPVEELAGT